MVENGDSPAGKVMSEAIELGIAEKSPYPEAAFFVDAGTPYTESAIARAFDWGYAAVLCSPDGTVEVLHPESPTGEPPRLTARPQLRR